MSILSDLLSNLASGGNGVSTDPTLPNVPRSLPQAAMTPNAASYVPDDAITQQYKLSDHLRAVPPATSWAGVAAQGLGAVGGNLVQGDANSALANNQALRKADIANAANATDLPSLLKATTAAQTPGIQDVGLKAKYAQIVDDPNRVYAVRKAQGLAAGLKDGSQELLDFQLTGKLPGMTGEGPYGKAGAIFQANDGTFYSVQFGANGKKLIEPVSANGTPLTPAKGVGVVGDEMYSNATGSPVRNVAPQLSGGEAAKTSGKLNAEGANALPKAAIALKQYDDTNDLVNGTIDKAISQSSGWTTGLFGSASSRIPGTPAHDLANTLQTIKSNLGFDKLADMRANSPTGGALGAVSDMENRMLQSTWASIEQSQSNDQLVENLNKIKAVRAQFADLKHQAYDQDVARFGAGNVPNPDTGKMPGARTGSAASPLDGAIDKAMSGNNSAVTPVPGKNYIWTPNGGLQLAP